MDDIGTPSAEEEGRIQQAIQAIQTDQFTS